MKLVRKSNRVSKMALKKKKIADLISDASTFPAFSFFRSIGKVRQRERESSRRNFALARRFQQAGDVSPLRGLREINFTAIKESR